MLATAVEIVAKKLVDVLGDKAAKLGKRDKTRASSYEAYYALRRIEETFATIAYRLEHPPTTSADKKSKEYASKGCTPKIDESRHEV
jgi:hypothetical protein